MPSSSDDHSSQSPPSKSDKDSSRPPPKSNKDSSSPPPPKGSSDSSKNSSKSYSPPPPKSKNSPPHKSPPSQHGSSSHAISPPSEKGNNKNSHHKEGLRITSKEVQVIIGITAAAAVVLIIMILICVSSCKRKKRRRVTMHYYMDQGPNGEYYSGPQQPNWQHAGPANHVIKFNPSCSSGGQETGGWLQRPPPPPPPMVSSGEVSSNYSGPYLPVRPPPAPTVALGFNQCTFTYEELATATNGFSQANLLGQGGFGYVHKGVLPNGKCVAVKSLKSGSGQGEREFQAEVDIISRVHHRHLVSLVGYCIAGVQRMLIYEFVPNNTLEYHLHGSDQPLMEWSKRITIALGAAKGLAYLHEDCHPRIIHRDIKASNILIDNNWEAMVADFGLAKLTDNNNTHVSTRVMGTFGYLAPEYASSGKLTEKSDVFSYGVMLLELITGRPPVDMTGQYMDESLADWARPILTQGLGDGNYEQLIDPRLDEKYNPHEMARMVACASASIRYSAKRRPKMSQIVRAFEGDVSLDDLNTTVRPGQTSPIGCSEYDTAADMNKFRDIALE